jgi:drug/metabolite transporter (DMT)-like permease
MTFAFILAVLSAVISGFHAFGQKVGVERGMDSYLLTAFAAATSFSIGAILMFFTASWQVVPTSIYWYGLAGGLLYVSFAVLRLEALKFVDATIFFPLYKVVSPAITAAIGVFMLAEFLSIREVVGIAVSCAVPLLLISRSEHSRQKNLYLGLTLLVVGAVLASISSATNAYAIGTELSYALPLLVVTHLTSVFLGIGLFLRQHKFKEMGRALRHVSDMKFLSYSVGMGVLQFFAFYFVLLAFPGIGLGVAYAINAQYFVIPVILSIWFYGEHWNLQKILALVLSVAAILLLYH